MKALFAALMAALVALGASAQAATPQRAHAPKVVKAKPSHSTGARAVSTQKASAKAGPKSIKASKATKVAKAKKSKKRTARKA